LYKKHIPGETNKIDKVVKAKKENLF